MLIDLWFITFYFTVVVIVLYCYVVRCCFVFVLVLYYINGMCVLYPNYCVFYFIFVRITAFTEVIYVIMKIVTALTGLAFLAGP